MNTAMKKDVYEKMLEENIPNGRLKLLSALREVNV